MYVYACVCVTYVLEKNIPKVWMQSNEDPVSDDKHKTF